MNARPSVLCPVDFSEPSRGALRYAATIAEHFYGDLRVLTVDDPLLWQASETALGRGWIEENSRTELQRFYEATFAERRPIVADLRFETAVGKPGPQIVARAHDSRVDLIVMSSLGRTGASKRVFGSTTDRVLRETGTPVLVTPPTATGPSSVHEVRRTIRRVIAPVDLSAVTEVQVQIARGAADALGAALVIVHALEPMPRVAHLDTLSSQVAAERRRRAGEALDALARREGRSDEVLLRDGEPVDVITQAAGDSDDSLVVMALHAGGDTGPRLGSVTYGLISEAHSLVLALPPALCLGSAAAPRNGHADDSPAADRT